MVVKAVTNLADDAKVRFGWLSLVVAVVCLGGSVSLFLAEDPKIAGLDIGEDADTFGWYFMALSMVFGFSGFFLGLAAKK